MRTIGHLRSNLLRLEFQIWGTPAVDPMAAKQLLAELAEFEGRITTSLRNLRTTLEEMI